MPRPKYIAPKTRVAEPPPVGDDWVKKALDLGSQAGEALSRQTAKQVLALSSPGTYRMYEDMEKSGRRPKAAKLMGEARRAVQPGWSGPTSDDKVLSLLGAAMEGPIGYGLGAAGMAVRGPVGSLVGRGMGWMIGRALSEFADPETAGRNLWWDVGSVVGAKALGTGTSMAYRSLLQPKLAKSGALAANATLRKTLDWAEAAMDPAIGPKASNYGLPRWLNQRLQRLGPKGVEDIQGTSGAIQRRLTSGMARGAAPGIQGELGIPTQGRLGLVGRARQQDLGLPVGHLPETVMGPGSVPQELPLPKEVIQEGLPGMIARQRVKTLKPILDELPPIPEHNPTISDVWKRYEEAAGGAMKGHLPGVEPNPAKFGPEPVPPVHNVGETQMPPTGARQFGRKRYGYPAGAPEEQPVGTRAMPDASPEGFEPTSLTPKIKTAAENLYATVARAGEPLTWKQYAHGMRTYTGMNRKEWVSVLRVHQGLAKAYGEDMDTMIGRMFRGVTSGTQHDQLIPGHPFFDKGSMTLGLTHFMEDQRALISFSDKIAEEGFSNGTRLEVALHEPIHVFLRWMPREDLLTLAKAASPGGGSIRWDEPTEHQIVRWMLEYLKGGEAPTPKLKKVFQRFGTWITELITKHKKLKATPEVKQVFNRLFTPDSMKGQLTQLPTRLSPSRTNIPVRRVPRAR